MMKAQRSREAQVSKLEIARGAVGVLHFEVLLGFEL
jgi:hypothetical protein